MLHWNRNFGFSLREYCTPEPFPIGCFSPVYGVVGLLGLDDIFFECSYAFFDKFYYQVPADWTTGAKRVLSGLCIVRLSTFPPLAVDSSTVVYQINYRLVTFVFILRVTYASCLRRVLDRPTRKNNLRKQPLVR